MDIVTRVEQEQAYSNLLLNQTLKKYDVSRVDAALTTELVYGTIQRLSTIDYYLGRFVAKGIMKLEPWVRGLLRISFYQLYYLDRIPTHAVVNEAVNIAKRKGHQGISGMVNGVLRNVIRQKEQLTLPDNLPPVQRIALAHAHPEWMVARWIAQYGEETAERICEANNGTPHVSVRVNAMKGDRESVLREMREAELNAASSPLAPSGIVVEGGGNMAHTRWFAEGAISIQDESSMLVAEALDPQPGMHVLDCCAAPGGKTAHIAEKMRNEGKLWANDIHPHKEQLIREQTERLGLSCVETVVGDALQLGHRLPAESLDRILLDAPCSGLGVIRRKPDLKWRKRETEINDIAALQYELLASVQRLLKPGGILVYSTCTIDAEENERVVSRFLQSHGHFELDTEWPAQLRHIVNQQHSVGVQLLPQHYGSDGFYIARLRRLS